VPTAYSAETCRKVEDSIAKVQPPDPFRADTFP
jgi:hypothetical protein